MSKIIENKDNTCNLFYLNNTIEDYNLPESFKDLKSDIKELYNLDPRLNDEISLFYIFLEKEKKDIKEKTIEVKTEEDYILMKKRIINDIKDKTILIEIENNKNNIDRRIHETFEEKMQSIIERELKNAGERIRNYLSSNNKKYYPASKVQDKMCDKCGEIINGDIYKNAINIEEKYYCEKCSLDISEPMFVIH